MPKIGSRTAISLIQWGCHVATFWGYAVGFSESGNTRTRPLAWGPERSPSDDSVVSWRRTAVEAYPGSTLILKVNNVRPYATLFPVPVFLRDGLVFLPFLARTYAVSAGIPMLFFLLVAPGSFPCPVVDREKARILFQYFCVLCVRGCRIPGK